LFEEKKSFSRHQKVKEEREGEGFSLNRLPRLRAAI